MYKNPKQKPNTQCKNFDLQSRYRRIIHCVDIAKLLQEEKLFATIILPKNPEINIYGQKCQKYKTNANGRELWDRLMKWEKDTCTNQFWEHKDAMFGRVSYKIKLDDRSMHQWYLRLFDRLVMAPVGPLHAWSAYRMGLIVCPPVYQKDNMTY